MLQTSRHICYFSVVAFNETISVHIAGLGQAETGWTNNIITKKDRSIELKSIAHKYKKGHRKIAVKVVDIFGNNIMKVI